VQLIKPSCIYKTRTVTYAGMCERSFVDQI